MCEKLIEDEKVRGQSHITEKYRGAASCKYNANLKLTKKILVMLLQGYDSI